MEVMGRRGLSRAIVAAACVIAFAGCTTNTSIANITTRGGTLEMAVGTINDSAGTLGMPVNPSLNVVTSFRNVFGNSAYQNPGTYTLTGPAGAIASLSGCTQLFSYGEAPGCEVDKNGNFLWGLPPAYQPPNQTGGGYAIGFILTGAAPSGGFTYTIATGVPVNGGITNYQAQASLAAVPFELGNLVGVSSFTSDHVGGGTFTLGNVANASEYLVVVTNGVKPNSVTVATAETNGTTATITGGGTSCTSGGTGSPIPCGANSVYVIGADYPLVEAGPPANTSTAPKLTGARSTSDLTVSGISAINE